MLTFEVNVGEYGKITSKELVSNGSNVSVTNENREEFVQLYLDWLLNSSIDERFRAFYLGKYEKQLSISMRKIIKFITSAFLIIPQHQKPQWDLMERKQRLLRNFYSLSYHCSHNLCFCQNKSVDVDPTKVSIDVDHTSLQWKFQLSTSHSKALKY